ncbi:GNAT family N-acetyltransferase [uncultured Microscilla sp.]|uniref:GNAT family N-acetyltransferase n=1 Tax=uncultured Microscilla sp. TaxID=432653 RepID=UPI00262BBD49|nr:GNAT family N-acetyltransferase [uncultured Microscilla sp.]
MLIRKATQEDQDAIWEIIRQVIAKGDTYVFAPNSHKEKMLNYWCDPNKYTYVAVVDEKIAGTFMIADNFPDLGAHVANAGYMTLPGMTGKGLGTAMGKFSLEEAKKLGYKAMQFNLVVKSNERAVKLWQKLGFKIIGEIPKAFQHQTDGLTNAYIMWQAL